MSVDKNMPIGGGLDQRDGESTPSDPIVEKHSANESPVPVEINDLEPHVRVIRPARPSLTYERAE